MANKVNINSGFFNAVNHDRLYQADDFNKIFEGILEDGILANIGRAFVVEPEGGTLRVTVGNGRAWFDNTWMFTDVVSTIEINEPAPILPRIDLVVLEINKEDRQNYIRMVDGDPADEPVTPFDKLIRTETITQYPLASINVGKGSEYTEILPSDITDLRDVEIDGTVYTHYAHGIMRQIPVEEILAKWELQIGEAKEKIEEDEAAWMSDFKTTVENWFATIEEYVTEEEAVRLSNEMIALNDKVEAELKELSDYIRGIGWAEDEEF